MIQVSIIVPCFNAERFLSDTLTSILNQSFQNWEAIVIDDCSTDNSVLIINLFVTKDKRFKLIQMSKNSGAPAFPRNIGLENASGRYIAFLDSDDIWMPNKLDVQLSFMLERNCAVSYTSYCRMNEDGRLLNQTIKSKAILRLHNYLSNTIIGFSSLMIDKEMVSCLSFVKVPLHEDMLFIISIFKQVNVFCGIPDVLMKYRVRKSSLSSNKIAAAIQVWRIYFNIERLGLVLSLFYFFRYASNSLLRRICTN